MWAHDIHYDVLPCGTLKNFALLKTALPGKDTTLVGELAMVPLPSRQILMGNCWGFSWAFELVSDIFGAVL